MRYSVLLAAAGTALAAWINVFSSHPDRFYVAMIGQSLGAVAQVFVLSVPPNLAAVWFDSTQVSTACAIGVFGNQVLMLKVHMKGTANEILMA